LSDTSTVAVNSTRRPFNCSSRVRPHRPVGDIIGTHNEDVTAPVIRTGSTDSV